MEYGIKHQTSSKKTCPKQTRITILIFLCTSYKVAKACQSNSNLLPTSYLPNFELELPQIGLLLHYHLLICALELYSVPSAPFFLLPLSQCRPLDLSCCQLQALDTHLESLLHLIDQAHAKDQSVYPNGMIAILYGT